MNHSPPKLIVALVVALSWTGSAVLAADWLTGPSFYTHDPATKKRVHQYSPVGPVYVYQRPDYMQSGYRHYRSSIDAGGSSDNLHIVEEWGKPVRPYDEWRFPYRPYSVPYSMWGAPFAGITNYGYGAAGPGGPGPGPVYGPDWPGGGPGGGPSGGPGGGPGGHPHRGGNDYPFYSGGQPNLPPWIDGQYPLNNHQGLPNYPYRRPHPAPPPTPHPPPPAPPPAPMP